MSIAENRTIMHRNVASKLYGFVPEEIGVALEDFRKILERSGVEPDGTLFFSMLSEPTADVMAAELFMGIKEDDPKFPEEEEVSFRSYFEVRDLVTIRILEDFDARSQTAYWELANYLDGNGLRQKTPVFVEYKNRPEGGTFVEMSVGAVS
ncbi:DUF5085 family protein [Edaphobacillus lindanitolerans]|uniref:Uncharacterized protein n=1 Tax=Edaphobacillus lindanitolerans TaxID=550447 RepID=A0A1U7PK26_9BACI|nr:DUF5085 family protein [Edaphobacillus lindanitolerans]SIT70632.1 protein of unknown function [Edaphobacillus lindanitolerans]